MRVLGYASLSNTAPTLDLAKTALTEPVGRETTVTIDDVLRAVSEHFSVRIADLQSKRRTKSIVYPRQVCMHVARLLTNLSLGEIGGYFGGRDHSTVIYADNKIRNDAETNPELRSLIEKITSSIQNYKHV